ncbi:MAG TPA: hypothetical protein EYP36_04825 [Calditrichaeota bacterium]|nr:hypothetical protein [Calditrichota bacterium]
MKHFWQYFYRFWGTLTLLAVSPLLAQTEISGFFDIINTYRISERETGGFKINQFEIDISKAYKDNLSFGAAIAYNNICDNIELSMVYLHYNLINNEVKHPRRSEEDDHIGIVIGKFDVPIGLDYLSYASPDRPVVSQPLIIEQTIAGWNDVGLNLHLNNCYLRFNVSALNGFNNGMNLAGDLVFKVRPDFHFGLFHTSDFNKKAYRKSWISGLSLSVRHHIFELKSEYLRANGIYGGEQDTLKDGHVHDGYYVQLVTDLSKLQKNGRPFFFTLRYSFWQDENENSPVPLPERIERYVLGLGYRINDYSSVRLEYLRENPQGTKYSDRVTAQLVVGY